MMSVAFALLVAFVFGIAIGRTMGEAVAWQKMEESDERAT